MLLIVSGFMQLKVLVRMGQMLFLNCRREYIIKNKYVEILIGFIN